MPNHFINPWDRTPRRQRGLPRQRGSRYAGFIVRLYRAQVIEIRAGTRDEVAPKLLAEIRSFIRGESITDYNGQPSVMTDSARADLVREFILNGQTLAPRLDPERGAKDGSD